MVVASLRDAPKLLAVLWVIPSFVTSYSTHRSEVISYGNLHDQHFNLSVANITYGGKVDVAFAGFSMFANGSLSGLNLTSAYEAALYQTINCDAATSSLMTNGYVGSFRNSTLTSLVCDTGCGNSIKQLHNSVLANCSQTAAMVPGLPFLGLVDLFWSNWNQSCFVDPVTGDNCNDVIAAFPNATDLSDLPTSDLCSYCNVEKLALMQADAYTAVYDDNWESVYEYVAGACNLSIANFNATTSVFNVTIPAQKLNCVSGNMYTTKEGDTCDSVALGNGVSAATMFYINLNILNCSAIVPGTSLCLPLTCINLYTVKLNDTCTSIAVDAGIKTRDVLSYNSQLNWNCTNLQSTNPYWGSTLCVSNPGGTYTGQALNSSTSTGPTVISPPTSSIVAPSTTLDCGEWYVNDGNLNLTCVQLCLEYEIAINLLIEANPSPNKADCDVDLVLGDAYCVNPLPGWDWGNSTSTNGTSSTILTSTTATATISSSKSLTTTMTSAKASTTTTSSVTPPGPTQSGITSACNQYYLTILGEAYCVGVSGSTTALATSKTSTATQSSVTPPGPTQSGITSACNKYYLTVSGDSCAAIEVGEAYCVGVSGSVLTTTTTPTKTATSLTPPGPTQSGITSACNKYYLTASGDSCSAIETKFSITFAQFYTWNPAIGSGCTNLWVSKAYCVGVSPPAPTQPGITSSCTKYYVTVSSDSCSAIDTKFGITFAQFYAWNPAIDSSCTSLWVDEAYCVSVS
ncbi:hypothetical protein B7463_g8377, partial [Scytalidium lignicola]